MKYNVVLLDLDGTLLDFKKSQKSAFFRCFPDGDEALYDQYETINVAQWARLERGEATREQILHDRFALFFEAAGINEDPDEMNTRYLNFLSEGCDPIDGAMEAVEKLSKNFKLAMVSNGVALVQHRRLRESGLLPFFDTVLISEEIGFAKPDPRFFTTAMEKCGETDPKKVLMIGDSLSADIAGGTLAGVDTCWFNPAHLDLPNGYTPTYIADDTMQFVSLAERGEL